MSCQRFHEAIADHACGATLDRHAAAHLDGCTSCQRMAAARRRLLDEAEEDLRTALSFTTSPAFAGRVAASVQRPGPTRIWPADGWRGAAAAAAAAGIVVAAYVGWPDRLSEYEAGHSAGSPASVHLPLERSNPQPSLAVAVPTELVTQVTPPRPPARAAARGADSKASAAPDPPVIVGPGQREAIARLRELLQAGAVGAAPAEAPPATSSLGITPLVIPEIVISDVRDIGGSSFANGDSPIPSTKE